MERDPVEQYAWLMLGRTRERQGRTEEAQSHVHYGKWWPRWEGSDTRVSDVAARPVDVRRAPGRAPPPRCPGCPRQRR